MSENICSFCKWWSLLGETKSYGLTEYWGVCHRNAPRPMIDLYNSDYPTDEMAVWPRTRANNFCGEFKSKASK